MLGETLHGPVPIRTVARLAEAVLAQHDECSRLQERVRALEGALRDIADRKLPLSGGKAHEAVCDMRDAARAALEGIEVE